MKFIHIISLVLCVSLVSSCGFRLKGEYHLATELKALYLSSDKRFSPLSRELESRLKQNQVNLLLERSPSATEIKLLPEQFQRRTLSLFPNGQVAEYELIYRVRYQVLLAAQEPRSFEFELSREFQDDPNNALAKERERQMLLSELRKAAADRIMSQLITVRP